MGIYLPNMKMPKACVYRENGHLTTCPLYDIDGYCGALNTEASHNEGGKLPGCPLVPVPPHGRLIDADALLKEMGKQENAMYEHGHEFSFSFKSGGDVCTAWYNVEMMVEDVPTIIPAEEGET